MNDSYETKGKVEKPVLHWAKVMLLWARYLQVPILAAVMASGLALIVVAQVGPYSLVLGAYDGTPGQIIPIAFTSVLYCFVMWDISKVIMKYGVDRFRLNTKEDTFSDPRHVRLGRWLLKALYVSVPVLTLLANRKAAPIPWYGWIFWVVIFFAVWVAHRKMAMLLDPWLRRMVARYAFLRDMDSRGYRAHPSQKGVGLDHLRQGGLLLVCCVISLAIYCFLPPEDVPAAIYVYLMIMGLAWICSGLAFFFWRHHVPLAMALGLWIFAGSWVFHRDYEYKVVKWEDPAGLPTARVILEKQKFHEVKNSLVPSPPRRIAVAAVGGGIHSGAWAVEVLTRLQDVEDCADFPQRVAALSGVSGGSYGTMLYAHGVYQDEFLLDGSESTEQGVATLSKQQKDYLQLIRDTSTKGSLGAVVRSMAYHDVSAYFAPVWWFGKDRGTAMEQQWAANAAAYLKRNGTGGSEDLATVTLGDWAGKARAGKMPAVLFTSGTEESGRPMVYGNSVVSDWNWNALQFDQTRPKECICARGQYTVPVITGARLSASFPFVSPAARPLENAGDVIRVQHQMDGGYYDNYGLVALNRWLQDGLEQIDEATQTRLYGSVRRKGTPEDPEPPMPAEFQHILVIQIRYKSYAFKDEVNDGGFFYQATAPLTGLYQARVAGQRLRADEQFKIFCKYWKARGVIVDNAAFEFDDCGEGAPLSWHLTGKQRKKMSDEGARILSDYEQYKKERLELEAEKPADLESRLAQLKQNHSLGAAAWLVREFIRAQAKAEGRPVS